MGSPGIAPSIGTRALSVNFCLFSAISPRAIEGWAYFDPGTSALTRRGRTDADTRRLSGAL
jgi:hypothetical protein